MTCLEPYNADCRVRGNGPEGRPAIQDVVPTMVAMMGLPVPPEMTGKVLF